MMADINWPCSRRYAHREHVAKRKVRGGVESYHCEGVRAHPSTMIGKPSTFQLARPEKSRVWLPTVPAPLDLDDEGWPRTVVQKIPQTKRYLIQVDTFVDLSAPIGGGGAQVYRTYQVTELLSGNKARMRRVDKA